MKVTNGTRGRPPTILYKASELKIEKGIVPPDKYRTVSLPEVLRQMEPGDSLVAPISQTRAGPAALAAFGKGKAATKALTPNKTRIWRLA